VTLRDFAAPSRHSAVDFLRRDASDSRMSEGTNTTTTVLQPGTPAPKFKLPASTGEQIDLADYKGKRVVLYFYPKADTPGCTTEACGFRDAIAGYKKLDVPVFGISPDPIGDVKAFAEKFNLNFPLLADADHAVTEKFGAWQEKSMYGKKYMGAARTTFVIGADGTIEHVFEKVKPAGHDQEVLVYLRSHNDAR
jgi:peroxiredoxin Q/BCP